MHQTYKGPPQINRYLPTVVLGIVWVFPCCGFITLDLCCLNYKSQLKLESSCHCPDMWLVGVIVFSLLSFHTHPFLRYLKPVYLKVLSFPIFTPPPLNPWSCSSRSASRLRYYSFSCGREKTELGHLLQPLFSRLPTREQLQPSFPKVPRQTIKLL